MQLDGVHADAVGQRRGLEVHRGFQTGREPRRHLVAGRAGQRVVINTLQTCGQCPACLNGKQNLCANWKVLGLDKVHGTYAEFISVPASCLYPISDTISEAEAIMTEPLANVVHFFRTTMSEVPDSLTIMGAILGAWT